MLCQSRDINIRVSGQSSRLDFPCSKYTIVGINLVDWKYIHCKYFVFTKKSYKKHLQLTSLVYSRDSVYRVWPSRSNDACAKLVYNIIFPRFLNTWHGSYMCKISIQNELFFFTPQLLIFAQIRFRYILVTIWIDVLFIDMYIFMTI